MQQNIDHACLDFAAVTQKGFVVVWSLFTDLYDGGVTAQWFERSPVHTYSRAERQSRCRTLGLLQSGKVTRQKYYDTACP